MPSDNETFADLWFPVSGLDVTPEYEVQTAPTTPVGVNVRAYDVFLLRARGGSRPGLTKFIDEPVKE